MKYLIGSYRYCSALRIAESQAESRAALRDLLYLRGLAQMVEQVSLDTEDAGSNPTPPSPLV